MLNTLIVTLMFPIIAPNMQHSPDSINGALKASTCTSCHGVTGVSTNKLVPNLCGQKYEYMVEQISAYKEGERKNPVMQQLSLATPANDMLDILKYFSIQKECK